MVLSPKTYQVSSSPLPAAKGNPLTSKFQFLVGVFASMGSALFGYDLGVIAEVVSSSSYIELFNPSDAET